jgi:formate hydrogenlyase subunit 3/multisubunit Na+/H+ antiporter MnhD subunit
MERKRFALGKQNYILMGIAGALVLLGFVLMMGSSSTMETYDPSIFSFRRIVAGPNLCFFGYVLMIVGIIWKGKEEPQASVETSDSDEPAKA